MKDGSGTASRAPRGRLITFEGGEGAGKSTQLSLLAENLRNRGIEVVETREPGGSPGAEAIRTLLLDPDNKGWPPMTEALLHFAARSDHMTRVVEPALTSGKWVLCDRFTDSTMAYQGVAQGLGSSVIEQLSALTLKGRKPDLTLVLDLDPEIGLKRISERGGKPTRYDLMDISFHRRLREAFLMIVRSDPARCVVVDATYSEDFVAEMVSGAVTDRLEMELAS